MLLLRLIPPLSPSFLQLFLNFQSHVFFLSSVQSSLAWVNSILNESYLWNMFSGGSSTVHSNGGNDLL